MAKYAIRRKQIAAGFYISLCIALKWAGTLCEDLRSQKQHKSRHENSATTHPSTDPLLLQGRTRSFRCVIRSHLFSSPSELHRAEPSLPGTVSRTKQCLPDAIVGKLLCNHSCCSGTLQNSSPESANRLQWW